MNIESKADAYNYWKWEYTKRNSEFKALLEEDSDKNTSMKRRGEIYMTIRDKYKYRPEFLILSGLLHSKMKNDEGDEISPSTILSILEKGDKICKTSACVKEFQIYPILTNKPVSLIHPITQFDINRGRIVDFNIRKTTSRESTVESIEPIHKNNVDKEIESFDCIVAIDLRSNIRDIFKEIEILQAEFFNEEKDEDSYFNKYSSLYESSYIKAIKKSGGVIPRDDTPRAVGLWLWDYVDNNGCTQIEAIRQLRLIFDMGKLGYSESESRVFRNIYTRTNECINQHEVLSFTG